MTYIIEGTRMHTKEAAHEELARALRFPDYYGRNLDALWDLISTMDGASVVLVHAPSMLNALGNYGCKLINTFFDAMEENETFSFRVAG